MKLLKYLTLVPLTALVLGTAHAGAVKDPQKLAEAANAKWMEIQQSGDPRALASTYTEDAILISPTTETLDSQEGIEAYWSHAFSQGDRYFVDVEAANVEGDSLYQAGIWSAEIQTADGGSKLVGGNLMRVLDRQDDGSWKIRLETWN
ncbi:MAG: YybH family protein [Chromatiales bacterium]